MQAIKQSAIDVMLIAVSILILFSPFVALALIADIVRF